MGRPNVFVTFLGHIFLGHMFWHAARRSVTSQSVTLVKLRSQVAFELYELRSAAPHLVVLRLSVTTC